MTDNAKYVQLGSRLQNIILSRVEAGTLTLPAYPKTAIELQALLEKPSVDLQKIAGVLEKDLVLSAHVLRVANSALHRRGGQIESVQKAVVQLGARAIKQTLVTAAARQVFTSHDKSINQTLTALWEHSNAVAFLARNIAGIAGFADDETAYFSGLLHDIGKAVAAIYLLEFERSLPTREAMDWIHQGAWIDVVNTIHRPVGAAVARAWNLPMAVERTIMDANNYDPANRKSNVNAVLFANALAKREGIYIGEIDHEAVSSLLMIGKSLLGIDDTVMNGLTRELNDRLTG